MASSLDRWFAPFEGTRNPYPVAIFRIVFFTGLAVHFFPSMIWLDESYARGALRTEEWNHWLYFHFWRIPHPWLRLLSVVTMAGCIAALLGLLPRWGALIAGLGCYAFASFNGLPVQTLALISAWAILILWIICGGGGAVWSIDALIRRKLGRAPPGPPREQRLLASLILYQILLAVFFAGIEKLLGGWPFDDQMKLVLSYPRGFMVRDWVADAGWMHGGVVPAFLSWVTPVIELGTPIALLFRRTRLPALIVYECFFLGIVSMLEVPPLFYFMFAGGALLALDDEDIERIKGLVQRVLRRPAPAPAAPAAAPPPPAPRTARDRRARKSRRR